MSAAEGPGRAEGLRGWTTAWPRFVRQSTDWRRFLIAIISGAATVLALAPFFFWPVLFITIPNLIWLTDGSTKASTLKANIQSAALNGWLFGFGYFSAGLFWIGEAFLVQNDEFVWLLPFAVTLMPAGLALFYAMALAVARSLWMPGLARVFVLALTLSCAEWLRGHVLTGFPWNTLGYALTYPTELMQLAAFAGVYGLTIWVVIIFALPAVVAEDFSGCGRGRFVRWNGVAITGVALATAWSFGHYRLQNNPLTFETGVKFRVVQASIPQNEKWQPANRQRIFTDQVALSQRNAAGELDGLIGITHVVWPEVALPFLPLEMSDVLAGIATMLPPDTVLITGALRRGPAASASNAKNSTSDRAGTDSDRRDIFNSLVVLDSDGQATTIYDKIHLVPFGEYLPFQTTLESLGFRQLTRIRGGFTAGQPPRPLFSAGALRDIAGLICYEVIFPDGVAAGLRPNARPSLYINVTNDGWFGNTTGPQQHFHQARVRAVETGVPILRAANNGVSAMIGPLGQIVGNRMILNYRGTQDYSAPHAIGRTIYSSYGNWAFLLQILCLCLALVGYVKFSTPTILQVHNR